LGESNGVLLRPNRLCVEFDSSLPSEVILPGDSPVEMVCAHYGSSFRLDAKPSSTTAYRAFSGA